MTINLTITKEMVVKGKFERPLPTVTFDIKQEEFLKLLGVYLHSNSMYILRVCKKYGYSLDSHHHFFHSLIITISTYGISVWDVASYDKYLSKIDKFQKRAVRFGFLKEDSPVLSLLEASHNTFWKSISTSTEDPVQDLITPSKDSKTRLLRNRGHSYVLPQIRTERFKRYFIIRCLFNFI